VWLADHYDIGYAGAYAILEDYFIFIIYGDFKA